MNRDRERYSIILSLVALAVISTGSITYYQNILVAVYPLNDGNADYKFGRISSVQYDKNDLPAWVLSGVWKSNLVANQSIISNQENETYPWHSFNAQFEMVPLNGTAAHKHTVTNLIASNFSQRNNSTIIFNGTATATLNEGAITDIPASISILEDEVIRIWLDPSAVDNHYGNTPIYGIVIDGPSNRHIPMS